MSTELLPALRPSRLAWNKGRIVGQKRPLQPKHVWSIRVRLEMTAAPRDLALSTWRSTASFEGAISSPCAFATSSQPVE